MVTRSAKIAAISCATLAFAGAALAQGADPVAALYTNTIKETRADGSGATFHFNADKTFMMMSPQRNMSGTYIVNAKGAVCITMTPPPGAPAPATPPNPEANCVLLPTKIGETTDHMGGGPNGQMEKFELVAGR